MTATPHPNQPSAERGDLPNGDFMEVSRWICEKLVNEYNVHGYEAMAVSAWVAGMMFDAKEKHFSAGAASQRAAFKLKIATMMCNRCNDGDQPTIRATHDGLWHSEWGRSDIWSRCDAEGFIKAIESEGGK